MNLGTVGILLLVLVCPIAMMLMMRGGGHGGHQHGSDTPGDDPLAGMSEAQLRELTKRTEQELEDRRQRERSSSRQG